jgi:hypothetical protein
MGINPLRSVVGDEPIIILGMIHVNKYYVELSVAFKNGSCIF